MPITGRYSWLFEPLVSAQAAQAPFLESGRQQEQFQGVFGYNPNMLVLPAVSSPTAPCSNSVRSHLKARQWTCLMLSFINHRLEFPAPSKHRRVGKCVVDSWDSSPTHTWEGETFFCSSVFWHSSEATCSEYFWQKYNHVDLKYSQPQL